MCGILGLFGDRTCDINRFSTALDYQSNRGPDNKTSIEFGDAILGHARLAVQDLSESANQPFFDKSRRYALIFNGEIYNYNELRSFISCEEFETSSDTEVLLYYLIQYGLNKTLHDIEGMFAFSFYDKESNKVFCARDISGEKPLYYHLANSRSTFYVSSSLYSLVYLIDETSIDNTSLSDFIHYGYVKGKYSIISEIYKVEPGHAVTYDINSQQFEDNIFFDVNEVEVDGCENFNTIEKLESLIRHSVKQCLNSDVPVGVFLSGGVDSSLVASFVAEIDDENKVQAFTVGFDDKEYDESTYAKEVAKCLNIDLNVLRLSTDDLVEVLINSKWVFDEPFADASYLATYALSKFSRKYVTVCLGGDGADELFTGYYRHLAFEALYLKLSKLPFSLRVYIGKLISSQKYLNPLMKIFYLAFYRKTTLPTGFTEKLSKLANVIAFTGKDDLWFRLMTSNSYSRELSLPPPRKISLDNFNKRTLSKSDFSNYLHEDVLTKVDRCGMAASLEVRAPMLNRDIIRFAFSAPTSMHVKDHVQKAALKEILKKKIPTYNFHRPKSGFSVPYESFLNGYIKVELERYYKRFNTESRFEPFFKIVDKYFSGKGDGAVVWKIYNFFRWYENYLDIKRNSHCIYGA